MYICHHAKLVVLSLSLNLVNQENAADVVYFYFGVVFEKVAVV